MTRHKNISQRKMRELPKILIHEHLDCSLRPQTMLELWDEIGFDQAKIPFPQRVLDMWRTATIVASSGKDPQLAAKLKAQASTAYQNWMVKFASASLKNYVDAIVLHVLPLMQSGINLTRITRERLEDAAADGVAALELRFAPQLHTWAGLRLDQVMDSIIAGIEDSPIPVKLIVCSLRHENNKKIVPVNPINELADLAIKYKQYVGVFDLAADEHKYPGVLRWWVPAAMRVRKAGIDLTIHLWETDNPTARDLEMLKKYNLRRIGHGIRGNRQGDRILEVCPTSNVVTAQVASFEKHPIDRLYRAGKRVTVNTDGTLFTRVDLTAEYFNLQRHFGWGLNDFYTVNLTALEASSFSAEQKASLRAKLDQAYGS